MQVHGTAVFCQRPHDREEVGCGAVMTAQRIGAGKKVQMGVYRCRSAAAMAAKHRVQNTMCKHGVQDMGYRTQGAEHSAQNARRSPDTHDMTGRA
eukprot:scaffold296018_cov21-Tisochrysis_lutea.AAC.1